jgi:hypothetical protein
MLRPAALTAVLAMAMLAAPALADPSDAGRAGRTADSRILRFRVEAVHEVLVPGGYRFHAELFRSRKRVGSDVGDCTTSKPSTYRCALTVKLANGTLHARSVSRPPNTFSSGAVTGGSGAYKDAHGSWYEAGSGRSDRVTITLS